MSVLRQGNWLGQQRVDVPHIRALESSIAADFDVVAGRVQAGGGALVVRGFTLTNFATGNSAANIQLSTADGIVYNMNSSESGTFLWVPADRAIETLNSATNPRISGGFTAGQTNYIGLDLVRTSDDTTSDLVQFLDPNTLLEQAKNVPLARTMDYRIVISTTPFSAASNIIPIAKVKTDNQNQVDSATNAVEDARNLMWRLGQGGDFPNQYGSFTWPQDRLEYDSSIVALSALDRFSGGDKGILSQKDWQDSVMTRLWELGGGQNWYSPTADRNVKMTKNPGSVFVSTADNFEFVASNLHWQGLKIVFDNSNVSGVYYNTIADQLVDSAGRTDLAIGECLYVDIDRTTAATLTAQKAIIQTLGLPTIPGSRYILAWRDSTGAVFSRDNSFPVNTSFAPATTVAIGAVRLAYAAGTPSTPTVAPLNSTNSISIGTGSYLITGNNSAITAVGGGTAAGITVTGGSTSGTGILSTGGAGGIGGTFVGGSGNGLGLSVTGTGTNYGAIFQGGATGAGAGQSYGIETTGGGTAGGVGLHSIGGADADAILANGTGVGNGLKAFAGTTGNGVEAYANGTTKSVPSGASGTANGGYFVGKVATSAVVAQGDLTTNTSTGIFSSGYNSIVARADTATSGIGVDAIGYTGLRSVSAHVGTYSVITGDAGVALGITAGGIFGGNTGVGVVAASATSLIGTPTAGVGLYAVGSTYAIEALGNIKFIGANPTIGTAITNLQSPLNVNKAWLTVAVGTTVTAPGTSPLMLDGCNIASVGYTGGGAILEVTFASAIGAAHSFNDGNTNPITVYDASCNVTIFKQTGGAATAYVPQVRMTSTTTAEITIKETSSGATEQLDDTAGGDGWIIQLQVFGRQ